MHETEPVLSATRAKVSIESSCNIIGSICSADAGKTRNAVLEKDEAKYNERNGKHMLSMVLLYAVIFHLSFNYSG